VRVVRELFGVLTAEGAAGGVVITSGAFTQEARNFARGKALKLVDGGQLQAMIAEVRREPVVARG
jgi:restriction system protein